uniref:Uncharacterized protein n=1 Tax=Anguilla anguilla TaxID=7936 RepID=A0A0E9S7G6_ANGAN
MIHKKNCLEGYLKDIISAIE